MRQKAQFVIKRPEGTSSGSPIFSQNLGDFTKIRRFQQFLQKLSP